MHRALIPALVTITLLGSAAPTFAQDAMTKHDSMKNEGSMKKHDSMSKDASMSKHESMGKDGAMSKHDSMSKDETSK